MITWRFSRKHHPSSSSSIPWSARGLMQPPLGFPSRPFVTGPETHLQPFLEDLLHHTMEEYDECRPVKKTMTLLGWCGIAAAPSSEEQTCQRDREEPASGLSQMEHCPGSQQGDPPLVYTLIIFCIKVFHPFSKKKMKV